MPELYERLLIMSNGADFGSNRQGEHGLTRSPSSGGAATDPDPCHSHPARGSLAYRQHLVSCRRVDLCSDQLCWLLSECPDRAKRLWARCSRAGCGARSVKGMTFILRPTLTR